MDGRNTFYITVLYKEFLSYTEKALKGKGLTYGQLPFILYIGKHEMCPPAALKNDLKLDWGHVQRSLTKLEKDGFIYKVESKGKKYSYFLMLTKQGLESYDMCHDLFYFWDAEMKQSMSNEEWDSFGNTLEKAFRETNGKYSKRSVKK